MSGNLSALCGCTPTDRLGARPLRKGILRTMRSRLARTTVLSVLMFVGAACTRSLDTDSLEQTLKERVAADTGSQITSVTCDEDVAAEAGGTFECVATEGSGSTFRLEVTQTDDQGNVTYEYVDASPAP